MTLSSSAAAPAAARWPDTTVPAINTLAAALFPHNVDSDFRAGDVGPLLRPRSFDGHRAVLSELRILQLD